MPVLRGEHDRPVAVGIERRLQNLVGLLQRRTVHLLTDPILLVDDRSQLGRFDLVVGEQKTQTAHRITHAAHRVDPRPYDEGDLARVDGPLCVDPGRLEQPAEPGVRRAPQHLQPEAGEQPVLPGERNQVGDGGDGDQIQIAV